LLPVRLLNPLRTRSSVHLEDPTVQIELVKSSPYGDAFWCELQHPRADEYAEPVKDFARGSNLGLAFGRRPIGGAFAAPAGLLSGRHFNATLVFHRSRNQKTNYSKPRDLCSSILEDVTIRSASLSPLNFGLRFLDSCKHHLVGDRSSQRAFVGFSLLVSIIG
jgi:hypothetical protein